MQGSLGICSATPPSLIDKEQAQLQLNSDGSLKVGDAGHDLIVSGQTPTVAAQVGRPGNATERHAGKRRLLQEPAIGRFHPEDQPMSWKG